MKLLESTVRKAIQKSLDTNWRDARRWFHGRGRTFPGFEQVTVDWYSPVIWITFFKPQLDQSGETDVCATHQFEQQVVATILDIREGFSDRLSVQAVMVQRRYLQDAPAECYWGALPEQMFAYRGDSRYLVQLGGRQNTGFFLDMEPGRRWLEGLVKGRNVLNLFAYTCAFSVVAQQAGATSVVNVDMSRGALNQGRENHRLNHLNTDSIRFLQENILKSWGRIRRPGPYDVALIDPPSFQRGSFVAERDYAKLIRRIPQLMNPGADILLCLNAPELDTSFLKQLVERECPECVFIGRLPASEEFPDQDPEQQLKLLHYRYQP